MTIIRLLNNEKWIIKTFKSLRWKIFEFLRNFRKLVVDIIKNKNFKAGSSHGGLDRLGVCQIQEGTIQLSVD